MSSNSILQTALVLLTTAFAVPTPNPQNDPQATEAKTPAVVANPAIDPLAPGTPAPSGQARQIKIFALQNGNAVEYAELLKPIFPGINLAADPRTNSLVMVYSGKDTGAEFEAVLLRLDERNTPKKADLTLQPTIDVVKTVDSERSKTAIAEYEAKARNAADQVRKLSQTLGNDHPSMVAARQTLNTALTEALNRKLELEQAQLSQLEARMERLRSQIQFRKVAAKKIVDRRARELLENTNLQWEADPATAPNETVATTDSNPTLTTDAPQKGILIEIYAGMDIWNKQNVIGKLIETLNKIPSVTVNVRNIPLASGVTAVIVRDPAGLCIEEAHLTRKESSRKSQINAALQTAGIQQIRWEEGNTVTQSVPEATADKTEPYADDITYRAVETTAVSYAASYWFEVATGLKVELVKFQTPQKFPFALRVREPAAKFEADDLIVSINDRTIDSWNRANDALAGNNSSGSRSRGRFQDYCKVIRNRTLREFEINDREPDEEVRKPDERGRSIWGMEMHVRRKATGMLETLYTSSICVSIDGLFVTVIPDDCEAIDDHPIQMINWKKTGRVVATDAKHHLVLISIDNGEKYVYPWALCRADNPTVGQRLIVRQIGNSLDGVATFNNPTLEVKDVGATVPEGIVIADAFTTTAPHNDEMRPGAALISITSSQLQGIAIKELTSTPDVKVHPNQWRLVAIPASVIESLINDYRQQAAKAAHAQSGGPLLNDITESERAALAIQASIERLMERSEKSRNRANLAVPSVAAKANHTQIHFPEGARFGLTSAEGTPVSGKGTYNFARGEFNKRYAVGLAFGESLDSEINVSIEIFPANAQTSAFLFQFAVPLVLTDEDKSQIASGNLVTKVLYLPHSKPTQLETVLSTRLDAGVDPIAEAERRGSVVAVFRMVANPSQTTKSRN